MSIKRLKITKSIENVHINQIKFFIILFQPFLINFDVFSIKLEHFRALYKCFHTFWIRFYQICHDNLKSDNQFISKIGLKSDTIMIFFEILDQVNSIT